MATLKEQQAEWSKRDAASAKFYATISRSYYRTGDEKDARAWLRLACEAIETSWHWRFEAQS